MNLQHVVGLAFAPTEQDYEARDSLLYALALGFGQDPLDHDELPYVVEGLTGRPQQVVPSMCMVLGWQPFWHDDPQTGIAWKQILHGEQHFRLHGTLKPAGRVRTRASHRERAGQGREPRRIAAGGHRAVRSSERRASRQPAERAVHAR